MSTNHRTLIEGVGYEVVGGRTKIGGTAYNILNGRTKISGTAYNINFQKRLKLCVEWLLLVLAV